MKYILNITDSASTVAETASEVVITEKIYALANAAVAAVSSVNGKTGAVTLTASDVSAVSTGGSYPNPSWITSLAWSKLTGTPTSLSGYGITDPVVLTSGAYSNPTWITGLGWSKISGTPTTLGGYGITDGLTSSAAAATYVSLAGSYTNPSWIVSLPWSKVTGTPTTLGGYGITDGITSAAVAAGYVSLSGSYSNPTWLTGLAWSKLSSVPAAVTSLSGTNTGDQTITLTGDVTGSGTGSFATTLANSGVTAASYGSSTLIPVLTIDAKGRVTSASTASVTTLPSQTGNNGKYLTTDGTNASWATVSVAGSALTGSSLASGITSSSLTSFGSAPTLSGAVTFDGFVLSTATYSTQTFAKIVATNAATNVNVVLQAKGSGYISALMPDGTSTGGNQRGAGAVDLQLSTGGNAANVATGVNAFQAGSGNLAGGSTSAAIGSGNWINGANQGIGLGLNNIVSGNQGFAAGKANTSSAQSAVAIGDTCTASASYGFASGVGASAYLYGQRSHSAYVFASAGDSQISSLVARNSTSNASATNLFLDGSSSRITVPANTTWEFEVHISARTNTAGAGRAKFVRSGIISKGTTAGSTTIDGSVDTIGTDRGSNAGSPPAGWAVSITADTTNGALDIQVTGAAATNIRWTAHIMVTETSYA